MSTTRNRIRDAIIMIYLLGNALTFNAVVQAERATMTLGGNWFLVILKALALSLIWPISLLYVLFA